MWYHLSLFLDAGELGVAYTGIATASALSQVVGGPLAAALLLLDGTFGLHGWQWLFLCEGMPTIIFAVVLKVRRALALATCCPSNNHSCYVLMHHYRRLDDLLCSACGPSASFGCQHTCL